MLLRGLPSITYFSLIVIRYFPPFLSASSWVNTGPMYSIMRLSYGIGSKAINPNPVAVRLMAYLGFPLFIVLLVSSCSLRAKRAGRREPGFRPVQRVQGL